MPLELIAWGRVTVGALVAEVVLIVSHVLYMVVYSQLLDPGRDMAVYEAHAEVSGPWFAGVAGPVLVGIVCWLVLRGQEGPLLQALVLGGILVLVDVAILALAGESVRPATVIPQVTKFAGVAAAGAILARSAGG